MKFKKYLPAIIPVCFFVLIIGVFSIKKVNAVSLLSNIIQGTSVRKDTSVKKTSVVPSSSQSPDVSPKKDTTPDLLKKVTGIRIKRYSTTAAKLSWNKSKTANYYHIYRSKKKNSDFQMIGTTKKTHYLAKKLKNNKTYYFYIKACKEKKESSSDSEPSKKVKIKTKTFSRKTVFAGDSITAEISYYTNNKIPIGGKNKVVAAVGLNTSSFYSKRIFNGMNGLQKTISENPYRVYIMLGINNINYMPVDIMIDDYTYIIKSIKKKCPKTDIVVCGLSPVTKYRRTVQSGFKRIPLFNKKLKKLAKKNHIHYFYYADFLKDSNGYLKAKYASKDGYHWKPDAYRIFLKKLKKYEKKLDN